MRKSLMFVLLAVMLVLFVSCASNADTSGSAKLYLTSCILPGQGGGRPGTFILPNGTRVAPGTAIEEGDYLYAAGTAKVLNSNGGIDYDEAGAEASNQIRLAVSAYLNTSVASSNVETSGVNAGVSTGTSSRRITETMVNAALAGLEECGYVEGPDGTIYILQRTSLSNIDEDYETRSDIAARKAEQYGDRLVNNFIDSLF